jgi:hypothetical protein
MLIQATIAALALLTAAMILLRILWMRVPPGLRSFLIRGSIAMMMVHAIFSVTRWGTTSAYVNVVINWLAIAGYELLVLLFSRLSPKWLTSISAAILVIPLFASSILLPLAGIFRPGSLPKTPVGRNLYYKVVPWSNNGAGNSGVDIDIYYRPAFVPFLSRKVETQSFNTMECNAFAAYVMRGSDPETVVARCPHWPTQPAGAEDKVLQVHFM